MSAVAERNTTKRGAATSRMRRLVHLAPYGVIGAVLLGLWASPSKHSSLPLPVALAAVVVLLIAGKAGQRAESVCRAGLVIGLLLAAAANAGTWWKRFPDRTLWFRITDDARLSARSRHTRNAGVLQMAQCYRLRDVVGKQPVYSSAELLSGPLRHCGRVGIRLGRYAEYLKLEPPRGASLPWRTEQSGQLRTAVTRAAAWVALPEANGNAFVLPLSEAGSEPK